MLWRQRRFGAGVLLDNTLSRPLMPADCTEWSTSDEAPPGESVQFRPAGLPGVTLMRAHFTHYAFEQHSDAESGIGLTYGGVHLSLPRALPGVGHNRYLVCVNSVRVD